MNKITSRQVMLLSFAFLCANTLMKGYSVHAGTGGWLALLIALVFGLFSCLLIYRLTRLYPALGFFDILKSLFGKVISKTVAFLFGIFCILDGAVIAAYMISFVRSLSVNEALSIPFIGLLFAACIFFALSKSGTVGRFSQITVPLISILFLMCLIFAFFCEDFQNIRPFFENGTEEFLRATAFFCLTPFCGFIFLFPYLKDSEPLRKRNFLIPTICAGVLLCASYALNATILGSETISRMNYPAYMALSVLNASSFFQRIEIFLFAAFILCDAIRLGIGLRFCSEALGFAFPVKWSKFYCIPAIITTILLALTVFRETDDILTVSNADLIVFGLLLFLVPFITWVCAEIKRLFIAKGKNL